MRNKFCDSLLCRFSIWQGFNWHIIPECNSTIELGQIKAPICVLDKNVFKLRVKKNVDKVYNPLSIIEKTIHQKF